MPAIVQKKCLHWQLLLGESLKERFHVGPVWVDICGYCRRRTKAYLRRDYSTCRNQLYQTVHLLETEGIP